MKTTKFTYINLILSFFRYKDGSAERCEHKKVLSKLTKKELIQEYNYLSGK